ncbi:MAG: hypothetical protein HQK79_17955 [Desulfobacterales bacterium]|nr:hypothetical protein [Desulfobacterales bacterium]
MVTEGGEGLSFGTLLAGIASLSFVVFVGYKISKKREEIRNTVELLTSGHIDFIKDLEAIVHSDGVNLV